jgi:hypothetical protein
MAVSFINVGTGTADTGVTTLTVTAPASIQNDDVLIAAIAVRPNTTPITPPAGWACIRKQDTSLTTASQLALYWKLAAGESGNYVFTLDGTSTGACGGILCFRGVSKTYPINREASQETAAAGTHATPDITTTETDTFIVAALGFANRNTTSPPGAIGGDAAMDERVDITPGVGSNINLSMATCTHAAASATGAKVFTDNGPDAADSGRTGILALRQAEVVTGVSVAWEQG